MKLLILGDLHEETSGLTRIRDDLRAADLVIVHGDLTNNGGRAKAKSILDSIRGVTDTPLLAQPGNMDRQDATDYFVEEGICLHGRGYVHGTVGVFGVGGSNVTPFGTPTEYTEEELKAMIWSGYRECRSAPTRILISHGPPHGTRIDRVGSAHVGSTAVRDFILAESPHVCVSGHIHEARGEDEIGTTKVFNTGLFAKGGYVMIHVEGKNLTAELRIAK